MGYPTVGAILDYSRIVLLLVIILLVIMSKIHKLLDSRQGVKSEARRVRFMLTPTGLGPRKAGGINRTLDTQGEYPFAPGSRVRLPAASPARGEHYLFTSKSFCCFW